MTPIEVFYLSHKFFHFEIKRQKKEREKKRLNTKYLLLSRLTKLMESEKNTIQRARNLYCL